MSDIDRMRGRESYDVQRFKDLPEVLARRPDGNIVTVPAGVSLKPGWVVVTPAGEPDADVTRARIVADVGTDARQVRMLKRRDLEASRIQLADDIRELNDGYEPIAKRDGTAWTIADAIESGLVTGSPATTPR